MLNCQVTVCHDQEASTGPEGAKRLAEHLRLVGRQVDHAVRDHDVDRFAGDQRSRLPQKVRVLFGSQPFAARSHRLLSQVLVEAVQVEPQVLDLPFAKLDVVKPQPVADNVLVLTSQRQHLVVAVDADDSTCRTHHLRRDVANLSAAGTKIEHRFAEIGRAHV